MGRTTLDLADPPLSSHAPASYPSPNLTPRTVRYSALDAAPRAVPPKWEMVTSISILATQERRLVCG